MQTNQKGYTGLIFFSPPLPFLRSFSKFCQRFCKHLCFKHWEEIHSDRETSQLERKQHAEPSEELLPFQTDASC